MNWIAWIALGFGVTGLAYDFYRQVRRANAPPPPLPTTLPPGHTPTRAGCLPHTGGARSVAGGVDFDTRGFSALEKDWFHASVMDPGAFSGPDDVGPAYRCDRFKPKDQEGVS